MDMEMADRQHYAQSIVLGFIFSFLLAKLFSVIVSFREESLQITRADPVAEESEPLLTERKSIGEKSDSLRAEFSRNEAEELILTDENENENDNENSVIVDKSSSDYTDSDDDWEGVESTELDEAFSAATAFVAATAADRSSQKVSNDVQLMLYGLYKIATEGPCTTPQPSALKMAARAKWQAWQKLGAMPPEEAMQKYIGIITELYPTWAAGSSDTSDSEALLPHTGKATSEFFKLPNVLETSHESSLKKNLLIDLLNPLTHGCYISLLDGFWKRTVGEGSNTSTDNRGPMGPVFSTYVYEEESANELEMDEIHAYAREGEAENLLKCIESGVPVDLKDSEGRTPLHWAVDRGHFNITVLLVSKNADVNAKDNEGQTLLHYAAVCDRESIGEFLVKQKADMDIKDEDGNLARDLCESNWHWLNTTIKADD